jgi:hypothetical protein
MSSIDGSPPGAAAAPEADAAVDPGGVCDVLMICQRPGWSVA